MDELLGLPSGTLKGPEKLGELENWNSMAIVGFIALVDSNGGKMVPLRQIVNCSTLADLLNLAEVEGAPD
jgi:hypothetical protein